MNHNCTCGGRILGILRIDPKVARFRCNKCFTVYSQRIRQPKNHRYFLTQDNKRIGEIYEGELANQITEMLHCDLEIH